MSLALLFNSAGPHSNAITSSSPGLLSLVFCNLPAFIPPAVIPTTASVIWTPWSTPFATVEWKPDS